MVDDVVREDEIPRARRQGIALEIHDRVADARGEARAGRDLPRPFDGRFREIDRGDGRDPRMRRQRALEPPLAGSEDERPQVLARRVPVQHPGDPVARGVSGNTLVQVLADHARARPDPRREALRFGGAPPLAHPLPREAQRPGGEGFLEEAAQKGRPRAEKPERAEGEGRAIRWRARHSHSIVAGGFEVTS